MSETNNESQDPQKEMTPQEYNRLRIEAQKELKKEISFLKTEHEYQKLECEIEEFKARRLKAITIQYQLQNPQAAQQQSGPQGKAQVYDHPAAASAPFAKKEDAPKKEGTKSRTLKSE